MCKGERNTGILIVFLLFHENTWYSSSNSWRSFFILFVGELWYSMGTLWFKFNWWHKKVLASVFLSSKVSRITSLSHYVLCQIVKFCCYFIKTSSNHIGLEKVMTQYNCFLPLLWKGICYHITLLIFCRYFKIVFLQFEHPFLLFF